MKRLFLLLIIIASCDAAPVRDTANRKLSSFSKISVGEGIEVILQKDSVEGVTIETENIAVEDVLTEVDGGELRIHLEGDNHRNVDVKVYVTYKMLNGVSVSSAASISAKEKITAGEDFEIGASSAGDLALEVQAEDVEVNVSSSGEANLTVTASTLEANVSSAGEISISGFADYAEVQTSSSGEFNGLDFSADEAELQASSGADIKVTVNERMNARASSGGSIRYKGAPSVTDADSSSGGSVRKY